MLRFSLSLILLLFGTLCVADEAEQRVRERYKEILVKSPKKGATFDRVYGYYVDTGQSLLLYQDCQTATQNNPTSADAWLLLGLVAERRNQHEQAVQAFQTAGELEPKNHLPMLYLGELLLNQRRIHEATEALEQANERLKTNAGPRTERRTVLQTLALAYTRFGNPQKSLETWNQLADLFPNDPDILVQVAETMEFDGRLDDALKQYRRLLTMTNDPAERVTLSLAAIDIMLRQGNDTSALTDLDSLLGFLDTESYLADAVRDRIDRIFERERNPQRQIEFYQKRIEQEPNDIASLRRLIRTLQGIGNNAEAEKLLLDAIKVSPSNLSLRLILVELLAEQKDFAGAIAQCEAMDKIVPAGSDDLIRWGTLILQNPAMPEAERRIEAAKIWHRVAKKTPNDPVALVQLADIFVRNNFFSDAERYYKDALALRPNDFSYREHLATFYHQQRRKDNVLETLLPAGEQRFKTEAGQLLFTLGYLAEASPLLRESAQAAPQNWALQYRYLESLLQLDTTESVQSIRELFASVEKHIVSDEQFALFLQQETQLLKSLNKTGDAVKIVSAALATAPSMRSYWHLAVLHHAEANFASAIAAIEKMLEFANKEPGTERSAVPGNAVPARRFAAELYEQSGNAERAIRLYQQLVQYDPARSGDHWKQIITLHIQRGELPLALEASQKLIGRGAENAERLRFVAELFLSVNRREEAVKLLRQALTHEPGNHDVLRILAQTLADAQQHEEAIELLWRLYERLEHVPAKLSVIEILTSEYTKLNRADDLVERLQQSTRSFERRRETMQALVRVFTFQGDYDEARNVLEAMLDMPDESRSGTESMTHWVLRELVGVAEMQDDFETAVRYQEMLIQRSSDPKEETHLFYLYDKLGDTAKTTKMFFDQVLRQGNVADRLELIDTMIRRQQYEMVSRVLDFLEIHEPEHWQIMFRRIMVDAYQNKPIESLVREFWERSGKVINTGSAKPSSDRNTPPNDSATTPNFGFADAAPGEFTLSLSIQKRFFPVLFLPEVKNTRWAQGEPTGNLEEIQAIQDARFLSLVFLLRESINKDFAAQGNNPTAMPQFRNTIEALRNMLPADSEQYDVLTERLRLEVWLLDLIAFDEQYRIFPARIIPSQINRRACQYTIGQIVRTLALDGVGDDGVGDDGVADWQPALFSIFTEECVHELVADRFKTELSSDAKLSERLSKILDNLFHERKIPPISPDERNRLLNQAVSSVKRSAAHQASLARSHPLTLSEKTLPQKTDRLLALWSEYVDNAGTGTSADMLTKQRVPFARYYRTLLWILRSQNREDDVELLEQSLAKTAQKYPLWFAENLDALAYHVQPVDDDFPLFSLVDYTSLERLLSQIKPRVAEILPFCTDKEERRTFCTLLFNFFRNTLALRMYRYDIFTREEQALFGLRTDQLWNYLHVPSASQQGRVLRQFCGIDAPYATQQQILNSDQMTRLVELDRSLQEMLDFAFYILDAWQLQPSDLSPALFSPAEQTAALSRYRAELQGDRPIDRTIIYSLVQNPAAVGNFTPVDDLFFRILLLRRGLDTKTQFAATRIDGEIIPIRNNYTEQLAQSLANRNWSQHLSATFGGLLQRDNESADRTIEPSSDTELLQLVRKLEATDSERRTAAEQLALALLYVRLQRFADAATLLDSMELSTAELPVREWIIACLAVQYAQPDSPLKQRGREAVEKLLNFRLSERDTMNMVLILRHYQREEEAQQIYDHLSATVSDQRLLSELFYRLNAQGDLQKENVLKIAQRILLNPAFLQNSRRLTADMLLLESTVRLLVKENRMETVVPVLETRLRGLRNKTDARILLATLYQNINRHEEAKALALELAQHPTWEPERRQKIVSLLLHFGLQRELEAMNRMLLERSEQP